MRPVLVIGPTSLTATIFELLSRHQYDTLVVHEPYGAPTTATYDNWPTYTGLSLYEPPPPLKRIRALPSHTTLRFAPEPKPRAPARQHKRAAFVRCYQRHRESRAHERD